MVGQAQWKLLSHTINLRDLDELGLGSGVLLFNHFRIPGESLDEGLVTLMGDEDVLTLLKYVPKFREINVYVEEYVSLVEQHRIEVMNGKGKGVAIEEILEDDVLDEQHKREERSDKGKSVAIEEIGENFAWIVVHGLVKFRNEGDKMKKKVSQDSVIVLEVIKDMHYNLDKFVENLNHSQDALEIPSGMEGEESDLQRFLNYDDASISGLSSDFLTWVSDDDVSINGIEDQAYEDVVEHVTDPLVYEDVGDEDMVEQLTDPFVYEEFGNKYVAQHATDPVENAEVGEIEGDEGLGELVKNDFLVENELVYHVPAGNEDNKFVERSDFVYVISESTRKRKRSYQDDVSCGYALIGNQNRHVAANGSELKKMENVATDKEQVVITPLSISVAVQGFMLGFNDGAWFGSNVAASSFCDNNVSFGNLEVFGLKGSSPRAILMGKKEMQKLVPHRI
ncbi:hypothetical protein Tco_1335293 [Tanacetum coccineum]